MTKIISFVLIGLLIFSACKEKKAVTEEGSTKTGIMTENAGADSVAIRNTITGFYSWYNANYSKLMGYQLYKSLKTKDSPPYAINWEEVTRYQQFISDTIPQLGQLFLQNQKRFLQQADSAFKVDIEDDIPYGFDYDWYTNSQEDPSYLLDGINASRKWIISVKGDEASVEIGAPEDKKYVSGSLLLYVGMKKENGQWKIAKIGND